MNREFRIATKNDSGKRLDVFISENLEEISRSNAKRLIENEKVLVNGKLAKASKTVNENDEIIIEIEDAVLLEAVAEDIPIEIIYEDDDFAVINKQQGMTVHAGVNNHEGTLVNALLFHLKNLSGINGVLRPGIVHRIDKDTSGLLVVAKNDVAHLSLSKQIADKTCQRIYLALVEGKMEKREGRIETFIDRSTKDRTMMCVSRTGRVAITNYEVKEIFTNATFVEFRLETGRTHQIRVHSRYLGHPIVGDKVYGFEKQKYDLKGQLLHAHKLILTHPRTGERLEFVSALPNYFQDVLSKLKHLSN